MRQGLDGGLNANLRHGPCPSLARVSADRSWGGLGTACGRPLRSLRELTTQTGGGLGTACGRPLRSLRELTTQTAHYHVTSLIPSSFSAFR